ncbi:hypothetical protein NPIL_228481 [Nephila pilipes]|uniref:Uncharacterized protein n=1 Tax=Nephila pilipes TaxID=299642 RepID=A0A8X6U497_NEPPI|nr:hypothetical protein NPIL_228481 [Nephila pilipes]
MGQNGEYRVDAELLRGLYTNTCRVAALTPELTSTTPSETKKPVNFPAQQTVSGNRTKFPAFVMEMTFLVEFKAHYMSGKRGVFWSRRIFGLRRSGSITGGDKLAKLQFIVNLTDTQ